MNSKILVAVGLLLLLAGNLFLINVASKSITGNAIVGEGNAPVNSTIGLILIVVGLALMLAEGGREPKESLLLKRLSPKNLGKIKSARQSGRIGTAQDLIRYAKKMGYVIGEGTNHTDVKLPDGGLVTQIPRHGGDLATGTYLGALSRMINQYETLMG